MIDKEELINKLLEKTVRFTADGHEVVVSQFENDEPVIRIDGNKSTKEDILQYNHIVVPGTLDSVFGVMEIDLKGDYDYTESPINEITPQNVGKTITITGTIFKATVPEPIIETAVLECRSCMRLHEVTQKTKEIREPTTCAECGGKSFKLLPHYSKYTQKQEVQVSNPHFNAPITVLLKGNRCSYDKYCGREKESIVAFRGVLLVDLNKKCNTYYVDCADDILDWYKGPMML